MVQIQGIKIGFTMAALVLALLMVNTLSAAAGIGIELSASGLQKSDVSGTAQDFQDPGVTGVGSQDPGFFGIAVGVTQTIQQLVGLTIHAGSILESWGLPAVIAYSIQIMIDLTMGIGVLQIIGRFKF
jgi:hypothetical protein